MGQRSLSHFHAEFYLPDGLPVRIRMNADFLRLRLFVSFSGTRATRLRSARGHLFAATVNFLCRSVLHPAGIEAASEISCVFPFDCAPIKE